MPVLDLQVEVGEITSAHCLRLLEIDEQTTLYDHERKYLPGGGIHEKTLRMSLKSQGASRRQSASSRCHASGTSSTMVFTDAPRQTPATPPTRANSSIGGATGI